MAIEAWDDFPAEESGAFALEDRAAPRFTLLIRTAKLVCDHAEYLCVIRDVSSQGISVRLFHPTPSDTELVLEMPTGECHPVKPVWQKTGKAGFEFIKPIDVEQMIRSSSQLPKRELRFAVQLPVTLIRSGQRLGAVLHNISQQGAMIECGAQQFALDQVVRMESEGLPEIQARIRWRQGNRYGLIFDTIFHIHDLAAIVHLLQPQPVSRQLGKVKPTSQPV